jgi:PTS system galactitol-specific IIC component
MGVLTIFTAGMMWFNRKRIIEDEKKNHEVL